MKPTPTALTDKPAALIVLLGALVAFGPLSIDMYLPSLPTIAHALSAPESRIQLSVGGFLVGFSVSMLLYGPLSDHYGRRPVLLVGLSLYVVASLACAFVGDATQLVSLRVLQAMGGGAGSVMGRAIVRDVFPLDRSPQVLSHMQLVTMTAPLLAPLLGGWMLLFTGWRTIFLAMALFGAACLAVVTFMLPETHPRQRRNGSSLWTVFRAYGHLLVDPPAVGYILALGCTFAAMFAYITGSPFIYIEYFGVSPQHYAYWFDLNVLGIVAVTFVNRALVRRCALDRLLQVEAALTAAAGLLLWTLGAHSLLAVAAPLLITVGMTGAIAPNTIGRLLQLHSERAGAAMALAIASQFGTGMLASTMVAALHDGTPRAMCVTVALFTTCAWLGLQLTRLRAR